MQRRWRNWLPRLLFLGGSCLLFAVLLTLRPSPAAEPAAEPAFLHDELVATQTEILSPIWSPAIQQWSAYIGALAGVYGLDPDLIAAVVWEESNGQPAIVSNAGAVGLMGVMPSGPGLEWRPPADELKNPSVNLRWGVGILAEVVRQSGGDLYAALAAYSGGWEQVNSKVPREYASRVLDNYGRAVVVRSGYSPDIASQWTIAVEIRRGYVPHESLLVLGPQPLSGLHLYGRHLVYNYVDEAGNGYYITGYAVPVALVVPLSQVNRPAGAVTVSGGDLSWQAAPGTDAGKQSQANPHIIMACLPSLSRLRGQNSTRWFAPSQCPSWHR